MSVQSHSTADVAGQMMGCSERWLIEQLRANRFPGRKVGRHWRMTDQDVKDSLDVCANNACPVGGKTTAPAVGLTPTSRKRHLRRTEPGGTDAA
jgi:hypothetical protein